jgi:hypothetical protein
MKSRFVALVHDTIGCTNQRLPDVERGVGCVDVDNRKGPLNLVVSRMENMVLTTILQVVPIRPTSA